MFSQEYIVTGLLTAVVVVVCVLMHYEGLRLLTDRLPHPKRNERSRIILLILALLFLHVAEIWVFGAAYYALLHIEGYGQLIGVSPVRFVDCVYYSASVFSTVGFGDIYPVGAIRVMTGIEGVTGLTMITWSASYTFVEMLKTWGRDD